MKKKLRRVLIKNLQKKKRLNLAKISRITYQVLNFVSEKKAEVSLSFVTDRAIARLNKKYLSSPWPTDVLAFPIMPHQQFVKACQGKGPPRLLGDVVISIDKTLSQAKKLGEPFEKELARLIIHGILHLIGYKDMKKSDRIKMFNEQEKIFSYIYETP